MSSTMSPRARIIALLYEQVPIAEELGDVELKQTLLNAIKRVEAGASPQDLTAGRRAMLDDLTGARSHPDEVTQTGELMRLSTTQQAALAEVKRLQVRYVRGMTVPRTVPAGHVLVHNHVRPIGFGPRTPCGYQGFRAWTQLPEPDRLEQCECGWAPAAGVHYRVGSQS